jgi:hypothetical protein
VVLLRSSYANAWSDLSALTRAAFREQADHALILGGTAIQTYGLKGAWTSPDD